MSGQVDDDPTLLLTRVGQTIAAAPDADWPSRLVLGCWTELHIDAVHKLLPGFQIAYICISALPALSMLRRPASSDAPNIHIFNMHHSTLVGPLGQRLLRQAHMQKRLVTAWTVNDIAWMRWCTRQITAGAVLSDDPGSFLMVRDSDETARMRPVPWRLYLSLLRTQIVVMVLILGIWLVGGTYDGFAMRLMRRRRNASKKAEEAAETAAASTATSTAGT